MIYLIEGIDKSGKSTFIRQFSSLYSIEVYRKNPAIDLLEKDYHSYFKGIGYATIELMKIFDFNLIVDRSFISDWIYSNRFSNNHDLNIWGNWEKNIDIQKTLILYFFVPFAVFQQRINNNPDQYMNEDDYDRYTFLYEQYLINTRIPFIKIDGTIPFQEQLNTYLDYIEKKCTNRQHGICNSGADGSN